MIDHNKEFIFIHIPKTAGVSIEEQLGGYGDLDKLHGIRDNIALQHLTMQQMISVVGSDIAKKYFTFTVVRNPYDRCVSEFFWFKRWETQLLHHDTFKDLLPHNYTEAGVTFYDWVNTLKYQIVNNSKLPLVLQGHNIPQVDFTHVKHKKCAIDFIARFENINEDFYSICDGIGIGRQQLRHSNKRPRFDNIKQSHYSNYYNDETYNTVTSLYADDISYFNYTFD